MSNIAKIKALTKQLYPTGRAFAIKQGSIKEKFYDAVIEGEDSAYSDATSILSSILPDNTNFTSEDATMWETRLGLITNTLVSLSDRKDAIIRKMNHPGDVLARQSRDYIENSLRLAGFDVYVYENIPEQTIEDLLNSTPTQLQQGNGQQGDFQQGEENIYFVYSNLFTQVQQGDSQQGDFQQGAYSYNNKLINHISESNDLLFNIGVNSKCSFFIGGITLGSFANVDVNRKNEFRQIILKLKPVQSVSYLLINYI